jgi:hypothetical protein
LTPEQVEATRRAYARLGGDISTGEPVTPPNVRGAINYDRSFSRAMVLAGRKVPSVIEHEPGVAHTREDILGVSRENHRLAHCQCCSQVLIDLRV